LGYRFDVLAPLAHLAPVQQTAVAIARALQGIEPGSSVLVLDEPTAAMPKPEVKRMFGIVKTLRASGVSVLYVSHHAPCRQFPNRTVAPWRDFCFYSL
jgi:ribose transport system ATP-binding protein